MDFETKVIKDYESGRISLEKMIDNFVEYGIIDTEYSFLGMNNYLLLREELLTDDEIDDIIKEMIVW